MDPQTEAVIQKAATEAANKTASDILLKLGVDPKEPLEVQKDMAALRELRNLVSDPEFQRDMLHLRKWRKAVNSVESKGMMTVAGLFFTGLAALLVIGIKEFFSK